MTNTTLLLTAESLSCVRQERLLFKDLSFQLKNSQLLEIAGANGAGKSSLLRILASIATPFSGDVFCNNQPIATHRQNIHYLAHENGLKLGLSVFENLILLSTLHDSESSAIDTILEKLQLQNHKHSLVKQLSAGQKRKTALARLLLIKKPLWILDEPLTALDKESQEIVLAILNDHLATGGMCIMTSHQSLPESLEKQTLRLSTC